MFVTFRKKNTMARSRNKHKHQQYPPHHTATTKPSRSVAVILAVIAAIMGLGLAWMMAADNLIWLPVSAIFGAKSIISRSVYGLVGLAAIFQVFQWKAIQERWKS